MLVGDDFGVVSRLTLLKRDCYQVRGLLGP
jgi:hypothetical protein